MYHQRYRFRGIFFQSSTNRTEPTSSDILEPGWAIALARRESLRFPTRRRGQFQGPSEHSSVNADARTIRIESLPPIVGYKMRQIITRRRG
ncbi:Phosphorylase [Anopheles sinensis]|uniref:Phosphorylase n=1 Tax=Anopheles sinensis TaxID=74873 RepID=A0A084VXE9_ANOSI|nr:Phosphorylase [Anopheles sinensis]